MKYMLAWKISPNDHEAAGKRFLASGAPVPEGLTLLGRWHAPGSARGWALFEGDVGALARHAAEWANRLETDITPVLEDEQAGAALQDIYGGS